MNGFIKIILKDLSRLKRILKQLLLVKWKILFRDFIVHLIMMCNYFFEKRQLSLKSKEYRRLI